MKRCIRTLAWFMCSSCLLTMGAVAKTPAQYSFSVVPQYDVAKLHKDWTPLLRRIEHETGITLVLKISASIERFETEIAAGGSDFAYMNPYHAVIGRKSQAYVPLLRDKTPLTGVLTTRLDGPYKSVQDLDGQVIGFPSPNAFAASLYMRALLSEKEKLRFEPRYLTNHSNVLRNVARHTVAAGGSVSSAFNDELPELHGQLRVVYRTPEVASHPIVVHPRVPVAVRNAVARTVLELAGEEAGRIMLKQIRIPQPVLANYARDYAQLEKLTLQKYMVKTTE